MALETVQRCTKCLKTFCDGREWEFPCSPGGDVTRVVCSSDPGINLATMKFRQVRAHGDVYEVDIKEVTGT